MPSAPRIQLRSVVPKLPTCPPNMAAELISHTHLNPLRKTQTAASRVYETRCNNDPMCYIIILHHVDTACGIYIHMSQVMDDTSRASERIRKTQLHLSASIHSFIYFKKKLFNAAKCKRTMRPRRTAPLRILPQAKNKIVK